MVRDFKPGAGGAVKRPIGRDFTLKESQKEFLRELHAIGNGVIRAIIIQDGLPVRVEIEDSLPAI
jgi:hypothetical protein